MIFNFLFNHYFFYSITKYLLVNHCLNKIINWLQPELTTYNFHRTCEQPPKAPECSVGLTSQAAPGRLTVRELGGQINYQDGDWISEKPYLNADSNWYRDGVSMAGTHKAVQRLQQLSIYPFSVQLKIALPTTLKFLGNIASSQLCTKPRRFCIFCIPNTPLSSSGLCLQSLVAWGSAHPLQSAAEQCSQSCSPFP